MSSSKSPTPSASSVGDAASEKQQQQQQQQKQASTSKNLEPTDQAVLEYLQKKGLGSAALDLSNLLKEQKKKEENMSFRERMEEEDVVSRNQRSLLSKSTGGGYGYDRDAAWPVAHWGVPDTGRYKDEGGETPAATDMGVEEARAYLDAFTSLQLWVLSLPDQDGLQSIPNPLKRAQQLLQDNKNPPSLQSVIQELTTPSSQQQQQSDKNKSHNANFNLPPSAKAELLAVTFALLVHTYCELLEVGMESTAHMLRDAFQPVYETLYPTELRDLYQCTTVEDIVRLNSHNSQHMEAVASLKSILVQVASYQLSREKLNAQMLTTTANSNSNDAAVQRQKAALEQKIQEYDRNIALLNQKYADLSQRASLAFDKMHDLPFLRRARAVRWQLTMATTTYGMLAAFLNSKDDSLLAMSTLLQTKCELHVEQRDPLPFTPACVLDDESGDGEKPLDLNKVDINWAAPVPWRSDKVGERKLPFPRYHLEDEYDDEKQATRDKKAVEFNRALLINGFRRLEALERKQEYETLPPPKRLKDGHATIADPLEPSILLTTLCTSTSGPILRPKTSSSTMTRTFPTDASTIWEESGIGLCCASLSPPDGRHVAVGCDDSAIRIWNVIDATQRGDEPSKVLLGHKNGFPVFDVDWNRDGRTLLSAGGDGSVRLWDTMAVGPFGEVVPIQPQQPANNKSSSRSAGAGSGSKPSSESLNKDGNMDVPGLRHKQSPYSSGAALAVYRGHAPSSPVWSVSFAPSGYYFASAGGDATARLWTTDRPVPVRLFTGHTSSNVNCVEWHPNCNYVVTGGDDRTVRLWDIQTGRTVRLLDGCAAGINVVKVSPCGRYVAGADYIGAMHLWDLGTGKKVTEFRVPPSLSPTLVHYSSPIIHRLSFSACGSALAAGGDDCCVRIWDVRGAALEEKPLVTTPAKSFATRKTVIMDLSFTKRNLLLSVGKFVTPVPLVTAGTD